MIEVIASVFLAFYVVTWIIMILVALDDFERAVTDSGQLSCARRLVGFTVFGPLLIIPLFPVFLKMMFSAIKVIVVSAQK